MTERELRAAARKAKRVIAHHSQWRNEPRNLRALRRWQGRLRRLKRQARELGIALEPPPPPPPPDPLEELRARACFRWQSTRGCPYWAPWGSRGWVTVVLIDRARTRGQARKVHPKTGEVLGELRVRLDRLVRRNPKEEGRDRPQFKPAEVWPEAPAVEEDPAEEPRRVLRRPSRPEGHLERLLALVEDGSTVEDW